MENTARKPGRKSRAEIQSEMTQSPEFKEAVAAEVAASVSAALAKMMPQGANAATTAPDFSGQTNIRSFAEEFAMAIGALTDQGTGRARVAPEVMRMRHEAKDKMIALIIEARAEGKVPTYQLRNKIEANQRIIEPFWVSSDHKTHPTEIDYWGVPNEAMVPISDPAKAIFKAFKDSIGSVVAGKGLHGHSLPNMETLGVTPKGMVVRNSAVTAAVARAVPDGMAHAPLAGDGPMKSAYESEAPQVAGQPAFEEMRIHHESEKGRYRDINVLGTIAQPARQSV